MPICKPTLLTPWYRELVLILLICFGGASAFTQPKPGLDIESSPFFYYGPQGVESFQISTKKVIIRFQEGISIARKASILKTEPSLPRLSKQMNMPAPNVSLIPLPEGLNQSEILALLDLSLIHI